MGQNVEIFEVREALPEYVGPINGLLAQLSSSPRCFTLEQLQKIVGSAASHLFLARIGEDVVVDSAVRGRKLGRAMLEHAIAYAHECGGGSLMLTSRPSRVAANALYRSGGFLQKETNVYKMEIDE